MSQMFEACGSTMRNGQGGFQEFYRLLQTIHHIHGLDVLLGYADIHGDLLPINNDDNFHKAVSSANPLLRIIISKKEDEPVVFANNSLQRRKKATGLTVLLPTASGSIKNKGGLTISEPLNFRQISSIIDVDILPETHRRVRLHKHGTRKPLGFYIRDGVPGVFISRLVRGGLAESTGLLGLNDEILEVNGIDVAGKSLDQVTDMMVANSHNLIVTVKPSNQRNNVMHRSSKSSMGHSGSVGSAGSAGSALSHDSPSPASQSNPLTARRKKATGLTVLLPTASGSIKNKGGLTISEPLNFRQISSIIDVDILPETHRRVRLHKHGTRKPLGFYIRDGVPGVFISRLVRGGLAESTGLLGLNDEILEVNGIDVAGKSLDQVTDMMVANSHNLIVTVKPSNQRNNVMHRSSKSSMGHSGSVGSAGSAGSALSHDSPSPASQSNPLTASDLPPAYSCHPPPGADRDSPTRGRHLLPQSLSMPSSMAAAAHNGSPAHNRSPAHAAIGGSSSQENMREDGNTITLDLPPAYSCHPPPGADRDSPTRGRHLLPQSLSMPSSMAAAAHNGSPAHNRSPAHAAIGGSSSQENMREDGNTITL
ncbi:unnamed protein product [Menidia menidia]|uniref:(Atlantic silverside) hypothetical protein n=1 Tax=Menidia menidia TaxID=238744 RepID=A0A8S4BIC6_9TELE|nr:unnamed protein product [Menidia menidia]